MNRKKSNKKPKAPDYKPYPREEDIYRRGEEVPLDDEDEKQMQEDDKNQMREDDEERETPEDVPEEDFPIQKRRLMDTPEDDDWNTENFDSDHTGDDLDVPGTELDDKEEEIGSEDEENNYYSLGGPRRED